MSLLLQYLQLCWFKNNPVNLYPSTAFLWKCISFYIISGIIVEANISDPADATLEVALRAIMAPSLLAVLVFINRVKPLFNQLMIAVFICENVIVTLGICLEIVDVFVQATAYEDVPTILGVALLLWYLAIVSYIFRQVFNYKMLKSSLYSFIYFLSTYGVPFMFMELL
ncbi:MAG: hypothetical protein K9K84_09070 [Methylovulum sp.]|jgi:hypothetical protein|nr:hypothetical protein [Methylovulum sp.]